MTLENTSTKTALIVGGTGLVGGFCLKHLLNNYHYSKVIALVRHKINDDNPKLVQQKVDFNNLQNYSEIIQADDIFCCLGTTIKKAGSQENFKKVDYRYPLEIATIALQNRAKQFFFVSALGANPDSKIFYNRVKGEVERDISKLDFNTINIFRPSLLLGERQEHRLGEKIGAIFMRTFSFAFSGKLKKYDAIDADTVAVAMVQSANADITGINIYESHKIKEMITKTPFLMKA